MHPSKKNSAKKIQQTTLGTPKIQLMKGFSNHTQLIQGLGYVQVFWERSASHTPSPFLESVDEVSQQIHKNLSEWLVNFPHFFHKTYISK